MMFWVPPAIAETFSIGPSPRPWPDIQSATGASPLPESSVLGSPTQAKLPYG